jgi:hypothetical protein
MTPFNTGKVKIGSRYEPIKNHHSAEDDFWSRVLLNDRSKSVFKSWKFWTYLTFYVFLAWSIANMR